MIDLSKFETIIKNDLSPVLKYFWENDLYVTLVGGAVRDYIIHEKLAHDLDFELRSIKPIDEKEWELKLIDVFHNWPFGSKVENLPFSIFRLSYHGFDLEFSSPRREFFHQNRKDHKNFEAKLFSQISYIESFSRRDFTVNAMGIEIKKDSFVFIDPVLGLDDLKAKTLRAISHDFSFDPVRFLRAIRFSFQLKFHFSDELIEDLKTMDLSHLSSHYVKMEMLKTSNSGAFWNKFRELCLAWKIPVANELKILLELEAIDENILTLEDWVLSCHLFKPLSLIQFQTIVAYFQMSESKLKTLLAFYDQALILRSDDIIKLQKQTWDEGLKNPTFSLLLQFKENYLKMKNRDLSFGLPEAQASLILNLQLDRNLGDVDVKDFMNKHNIPITYSSSLRFFFHLKALSV